MNFEIISERYSPIYNTYIVKIRVEKEIESSIVTETFKVEILDGDDIQEAVNQYIEDYLPELLWG